MMEIGLRQACYFSAAHQPQSRAILDQGSWTPQIIPCVHHKWHTDAEYETELVKAQDLGPKFHHTIRDAVVHFGDIPAE